MTKENKLALVVGFGLVLLVGILISDHFSTARKQAAAELVQVNDPLVLRDRQSEPQLLDFQPPAPPDVRNDTPGVIQRSDPNAYGEPVAVDPHTLGLPEQDSRASREQQVVSVLQQQTPRDVQWVDIGVDANGNRVLRPVQPPARTRTQQKRETSGTVLAPGERSHTIAAGESLSSICAKYYGDRSLVDALAKHNKLGDPNVVKAGSTLRIPTLQTIAGPSVIAQSQASSANVPAEPKTCTVQAGDTLSSLAAEHLGSAGNWQVLYEFNKDVINDPDTVVEGTVIRIPN